MSVKNYSADEVTVIFNGIPVIGGAEGTFVSVSMDSPAWNLMVGSDGEAVRARSNNDSATFTVTLMQSSETNDAFSVVHNNDKLFKNGAGPFMLKDQNGTTLVTAQTAWIEKFSDIEYGKDASTRQWTIKTDKAIVDVGGNFYTF